MNAMGSETIDDDESNLDTNSQLVIVLTQIHSVVSNMFTIESLPPDARYL